MKGKKKIAALILAGIMCVSLTGCGIVTIVPKGQEALFTGEEETDISASSADDWTQVVEEITENAEDLATVAADADSSTTYSVSFTGTVSEYNTDSPKGYLLVEVDGVDDEVHIQVGSVYSGTTIRDSQTLRAFQDFENQTEWSEYGSALNDEVQTNVVDANGIGDDTVGSTITVIGCYKPSSDGVITVTPVSVTVE